MRGLDPDYELVSCASSSKYSQPTEQLGYMALVTQSDCYFAILQHLAPHAQLVNPAMKSGVFRPHIC
jgi:hypothetical protein